MYASQMLALCSVSTDTTTMHNKKSFTSHEADWAVLNADLYFHSTQPYISIHSETMGGHEASATCGILNHQLLHVLICLPLGTAD